MTGNHIEKLLDKISEELAEFMIFVGVLDSKAKLINFRRGKSSFCLSIERQETLDVQISLMLSLVRQLEDISSTHKFTVIHYGNQDIFLFGRPDLVVFIITVPMSEKQAAEALVELVNVVMPTRATSYCP